MTALKKTVRTRRGVEPAGRYLRRCCESNCPLTSVRRCSASAQVAEARRRAPGSVPSPRCGPGPPRRAFAASTAAAPDRSALCDFFDSQRAFAPPGRVRGPRAARKGSGALGGRVLAGSYFLGTPDPSRGGRGPERAAWLFPPWPGPRRGRGAGGLGSLGGTGTSGFLLSGDA